MILRNLSQKRKGLLKLRTFSTLISKITCKITSHFTCWTDPSRKYWCWCNLRNMIRWRWIFILNVIIRNWSWKPIKEAERRRRRRRHNHRIRLAGQRWHTHQVRLVGQEIFIKFNISSNEYIMRMWLKNSITFYIFRISNKYALFTFRLQCFSFFIRNVSPCFTTKHTKVRLTSSLILLHASFGVIPCKALVGVWLTM